ncbi:MAG: hypothetical protein JW709_09340 [Sedimentisphaerales bacterium]|nr:hypothetical protein [Sedimentisphaerales bacterium]
MKRSMAVWVVVLAGLAVSMGCQSAPVCKYHVGDVDTVSYTQKSVYKNWVEMPGKDKDQVRMRTTEYTVVLRREVESVGIDGSAVMNATFEQVKFDLNIDFPDKDTHEYYLSTPDKTESSRGGEAMLGGRSFKVRVAPDTTVLEIMGRDALLEQLGLSDKSTGTAMFFVSEEQLKKYLERDLIQNAPGMSSRKVMQPIPDSMVKAKAVEMTYKTAPAIGDVVTIQATGEAIFVVPKGMTEPEPPAVFGQKLIFDNSDMQEFALEGSARFDLAAGKVLEENKSMRCMLVLLEENLFGGKGKEKPGGGGVMFTEILRSESFAPVQ